MGSSAATTATFCATLVDEWLHCGVCHAVVSPGSRSTPIALEIANRHEIEMHIFHDERSAAFTALGIAKASGVPAILVCSSGTAAVEFHPAIVEAHHSEVPILICTADRPAELQGVGAPQTIDQQNLYGVSVRKFVNAEVADDSESHTWRQIARDLFATSLGKVRGPVHLNLRFREPLMGVATSLPPRHESSATIAEKVVSPSARSIRKLKKALNAKNGVIIAGPENYRVESILRLAEILSWPVLADPRSGARVPSKFVVAAADSILRDEDFAKKLQPQVVLRFGTLPASKVVNSWLASSGAKQIVITTTSTLVDPDRLCALHIVGEIDELCAELVSARSNEQSKLDDFSWLDLWGTAENSAQRSINTALADEPGLSEPGVARALYGLLPEASNLVVSSSMPIRDVEWFAAPRTGLRVHANRGANGIDGVVSTAVGIALATRQPTTLLIGDIALLHDVNGLISLVSREIDLRIVVIDNNGGGIFSFLPQAQALEVTKFEKIFGTPHGVNLKMLAQAHEIDTHEVANVSDFAEILSQRGPWLARVVTDRQENVKVHERINQ
ncbi:MAG: 2-succinyl-5-enolpyruvyl-6-hydroxy-3-cyclohexene-1-carboxylic-acid synthase, partial [Acidimicrobiaceae bacterium]